MLQALRQTRSCRTSAQTVWPAFCPTPQATSGRATPSGCSAALSRPPHGVGGLLQARPADQQAAQQARASRGQLLQAKARVLPPAQQERQRASSNRELQTCLPTCGAPSALATIWRMSGLPPGCCWSSPARSAGCSVCGCREVLSLQHLALMAHQPLVHRLHWLHRESAVLPSGCKLCTSPIRSH